MIFVTTGTQLPFPRLVAAMEDYAARSGEEVVAQVGPDTEQRPHLVLHDKLDPDAFEANFLRARVIVGHCGIGTVLSAKRLGKPLIVMPRRHDLGEHRNDHQMATAQHLSGRPGLFIAHESHELQALLERKSLTAMTEEQGPTIAGLQDRIRREIYNL